MQYLDSNSQDGLTLGGKGEIRAFGLCDASNRSGGDSKSQLAFAFFLNLFSGTVLCRSTRGTTVDLSSAEAELKAIFEAVRQTIWLRAFLAEVGHPQLEPTVIMSDNKSAMFMAELHNSSRRADHLVKIYNFIHQEIEAGTVALKYIAADDNVADLLTKPLPAAAHENLTNKLLHGFDGIAPRPGSVATPHQLRLKAFAKARAAHRRLTKGSPVRTHMINHEDSDPSSDERSYASDDTGRLFAWHNHCDRDTDTEEEEDDGSSRDSNNPDNHPPFNAPPPRHSLLFPIYRFKHISHRAPLFQRFLNRSNCEVCGIDTWIGFEFCPTHLLQQKHLQIRRTTRLVNGVDVPMLGLFASNGSPLRINRSTNLPYPSYQQRVVFPANTTVIQYFGEPFGEQFIGDHVTPGQDDLATFHSRSPLLL